MPRNSKWDTVKAWRRAVPANHIAPSTHSNHQLRPEDLGLYEYILLVFQMHRPHELKALILFVLS